MAQPAAGQKRKRDGGDRQQQQHGRRPAKGKQRACQSSSKAEPASIGHKLHHCVQLVTRTAKKARTFEIQKLVRKIKSDKAKGGDLQEGTSKLHSELDEILTALKALDIEDLATTALSAKLRKDRSGLQDNEDVQAFIGKHQARAIDGATILGKAQGRVMASKLMVQCLQEVLDSLRLRAGLQSQSKTPGNQTDAKKKESSKSGNREADSNAMSKAKAPKSQPSQRANGVDDDATSSEDDEEDEDNDESDGTASHLSAEESMPDDEEFQGIPRDAKSAAPASDSDADSDSDSVSNASTSSFPIMTSKTSKPLKKATKSAKTTQAVREHSPPTTSAFLPSLAAGYTLGDSDGSVYSDEDDVADTKPQRKNRRGQQARRAIWERKYGKNAKHVVKANERDMATEEARQKARAEKEIEAQKKSGRYVYGAEINLIKPAEGKNARSWAAPGEGKSMDAAQIVEKAKISNALHPSWEASKKAKEAQKNLAMAKPAGKKIVFD